MRCPKCGYISFDHLNRCQKCQTDLTNEQSQLNLLGVKPNPISLQNILEREAKNSSKKTSRFKEEAPFRPSRPNEPERMEFLLEGGISGRDSNSTERDKGAKGQPVTRKVDGEIEFSLEGLDLSIIPKKDN